MAGEYALRRQTQKHGTLFMIFSAPKFRNETRATRSPTRDQPSGSTQRIISATMRGPLPLNLSRLEKRKPLTLPSPLRGEEDAPAPGEGTTNSLECLPSAQGKRFSDEELRRKWSYSAARAPAR